eukprot:565281-Amphidinium_carterae.1
MISVATVFWQHSAPTGWALPNRCGGATPRGSASNATSGRRTALIHARCLALHAATKDLKGQ